VATSSAANLGKLDPKLRHIMARARSGQPVSGAAVTGGASRPTELIGLLQRLSVNRSATEKLAKRAFRGPGYRDARINGVFKAPGGKYRVQVSMSKNRGDGVYIAGYRRVTLTQAALDKLLAE
jgi:hypothetical protein